MDRWHDLRKDPTDIPKHDGSYWVHGIWKIGKHHEGMCTFRGGFFSVPCTFNVIAWKEIGQFEYEKETDK